MGSNLVPVAVVGEVGGLPEVLTVEEAAAVLRIGRGLAYEQAQLFRQTQGREGLPVLVIGRCFRVPRSALEALLGLSGVSRALQPAPAASSLEAWPESRPESRPESQPQSRAASSTSATSTTRRSRLPALAQQPQSPLPFAT